MGIACKVPAIVAKREEYEGASLPATAGEMWCFWEDEKGRGRERETWRRRRRKRSRRKKERLKKTGRKAEEEQ